MKMSQLKSLIKESIREVLSEAETQLEFPFDDTHLENKLRNLLKDPKWPNFLGVLELAQKYNHDEKSMDIVKRVMNQAMKKREEKYRSENSKLQQIFNAFGGVTSFMGGRQEHIKKRFKKSGIDLDS